jgi:ABC-2 type transport system permease protein
MSTTLLIARRELSAYLRSWTGYVIIAVMLAVDGLLFNAFVLGGVDKRSAEVVAQFFLVSSIIVMIASVFVSMRTIAEERQTGTINLLYSSPISDNQIVLGKFLSAFAFLAIFVLSTIYMPLLVLVNGKVSYGHLAAGYTGLLLLGSASIAIGTFGSTLARSQIVAAVVSAVLLTALGCLWYVSRVSERPMNDILAALALHGIHFQPFQQGIVHTRDIVYYLAITYIALFGATRVLEARRWK